MLSRRFRMARNFTFCIPERALQILPEGTESTRSSKGFPTGRELSVPWWDYQLRSNNYWDPQYFLALFNWYLERREGCHWWRQAHCIQWMERVQHSFRTASIWWQVSDRDITGCCDAKCWLETSKSSLGQINVSISSPLLAKSRRWFIIRRHPS